MNWPSLFDRWQRRTPRPEVLISKGKGCDWSTVERLRLEMHEPLVWTLNNDVHPWSDLHFDVHMPRHHPIAEHIPQMLHWSVDCQSHPYLVAFPIEHMPRKKLGCSTAYMLALAWLLRKTLPKLRVMLVGCDYNATPEEREKEKFSIIYWLGRLDEQGPRVEFATRSRLLIDEDYR